MGAFSLEFVWKIDYAYCLKGTFLDTYAAARAQHLRYDEFTLFELYSFNFASDLWTKPIACPIATGWLTLVQVDYGNSDL